MLRQMHVYTFCIFIACIFFRALDSVVGSALACPRDSFGVQIPAMAQIRSKIFAPPYAP